jgi:NADH-quinone oxidoreductase subunit L
VAVLGAWWGKFLWAVGAVAALMTAFYMSRVVFLTFYGEERLSDDAKHHLHESPPSMIYPLMVLAFLSLVGGWVGIPGAIGDFIGVPNFFHDYVGPLLDPGAHGGGHGVQTAATAGLAYAADVAHGAEAAAHGGSHSVAFELFMMCVSVAIALVGIGLGYFFYIKNTNMPLLMQFRMPKLHKTLLNKWYVDEIYNFAIVGGTKQFALLLCWIDANIVDGIVNGAATVTRGSSSGSISFDGAIVDGLVNLAAAVVDFFSRILRRLQTGYVQNYALAMAIGVFVLLVLYVYEMHEVLRNCAKAFLE